VKLARAAWPVLVGVLLGLAGGAVWTLFQSDSYRAEARVQVRGEASGLVPAVKALAESRLLEQNVAQTLRLAEEPEVTASGGNGGIVTLAAEAGTSERARQLDGEAAIVLGHLVVARFGNRRADEPNAGAKRPAGRVDRSCRRRGGCNRAGAATAGARPRSAGGPSPGPGR
jgi:hypothetical protein